MTTPPATKISEARKTYTPQEWTWMTGRLAPLVVDPPSAGLASEEGMSHRHAALMDIGRDMAFLVPFCVRLHTTLNARSPKAPPDWTTDITEGWSPRQAEAIEKIALAFEADGMYGKRMQSVGGATIDNAVDVYWPYLEDLFDDALYAIEWQLAYAKEESE